MLVDYSGRCVLHSNPIYSFYWRAIDTSSMRHAVRDVGGMKMCRNTRESLYLFERGNYMNI